MGQIKSDVKEKVCKGEESLKEPIGPVLPAQQAAGPAPP
jgi:hypothetical protein